MAEYRVVRTDEGSIQTDLDLFADAGWELFDLKWSTIDHHTVDYWPPVILIFERQ